VVRILVVEDDEALRTLLRRGLGEDGHVVDALPDGRDVDAYLAGMAYDVVILDLGLPYEDGLSLLRRMRKRGDATPVLVLTARDAVEDVVAGLDAGADDYLCKPFAFTELEARLRSLGRRVPAWSGDVLSAEGVTFNCMTREAHRGERALELTAKEATFLEVMMRNHGRTVPRALIETRLWDRASDPESNVLDVYARRLRLKLAAGGEPQLLHTVRGVGFRFELRP
jgi:two-component system response regulator MprA